MSSISVFVCDAVIVRVPSGFQKAPGHEIAIGRAPAVRCTLWGLYEPGTVKPDFSASFALSSILLFDLKSPFFRPDPGVCGARRARSVKDGAIAPPAGLSLTDRAPRYAGAIEGRCLVAVFSVCLGMLVVGGFSVDGHVACDDRISLYPAAPFRLATLLHAWTIAQVGRGSSLARQTGWARSANPHNSHTSDPPDAPEGASEL